MIPRDVRELLEQVLEEFDDAKSYGLVIISNLEPHPYAPTTTCVAIRFDPKVEVQAVQKALAVICTKYTNTGFTCNVTQVGIALAKKFFFWFKATPCTPTPQFGSLRLNCLNHINKGLYNERITQTI